MTGPDQLVGQGAAELGEQQQEPGGRVNRWVASAQALAVLGAAVGSGALDVLAEPGTAAEVTERCGLDPGVANALLEALRAHDLVEDTGDGRLRLAPDVAALRHRDATQPLSTLLPGAWARIDALRAAAGPPTRYTQPDDTGNGGPEVLAVAASTGISALSPARVRPEMLEALVPELVDRMRRSHHVEIGCGVGNMLFSLLLDFPDMTAVGVEIDPATVAEARRRAELLGVADRVELRGADAAELTDYDRFDTAQWSQFFFPTPSRPAVLAAAYRALKPGGLLIMPLLTAPGFPTAGTPIDQLQDVAVYRLLLTHWGIPVHGAEELTAEVTAAGFHVTRAMALPAGPLTSGGLLLADRPI